MMPDGIILPRKNGEHELEGYQLVYRHLPVARRGAYDRVGHDCLNDAGG